MNSSEPASQPLWKNPIIRALIVVVFFTYSAQNLLNVSIAPLSRQLELAQWAIGFTVSLAALCVTLLSQFWGRRSISWGRRPVLLFSLALAFAASLLFSFAVFARDAGWLGSGLATFLIIVARGLFFGCAVSAIPPTGQALIMAKTKDQASRIRGMSAFSGAINGSIMAGSIMSAALGTWWIFGPVYTTPWLLGTAFIITFFAIPRTPAPKLKTLPPRVKWSDHRILPWILAVIGVYYANGVAQITLGFLVIDRLHTDPQSAMPLVGALIIGSALGALAMQLWFVPKVVWAPVWLLRAGLTMGTLSAVVIFFANSFPLLLLSAVCLGIGIGLAGPGFTSGASLAVTTAEQGGVAGVLNAAGSFTWIFAPVLATALYSWHPFWPFFTSLAVLLISLSISWFHPALRRTLTK